MNTKSFGFACATMLPKILVFDWSPAVRWLVGALYILMWSCQVQAGPPLINSGSVASSHYAITSSGPHQNVWKQVTPQTNLDGSVTPLTSSYTELATGLNHLVNGQWVRSSTDIQITPDGNGAATNTQHQVFFAANINISGSIDLIKPDGQHLAGTVLGLSLYDASTGSNTIIAQLQDSIGQILQTSNQVIYTNALVDSDSDFQADVLYTQKKTGFEQDIVLHQQPPAPSSFGLNPDTTMLQVWTEFIQAPDPDISTKQVAVQVQSGGRVSRQTFPSETLNFGSMQMDQGNAYANQSLTNSGQSTQQSVHGLLLVPVAKHWVRQNGRKFLVEEVPFDALAAQLKALPPASSSTNSQARIGKRPSFFQQVALSGKAKSRSLRIAKVNRDTRPALVLDYNLIINNLTNVTFQSDTTYLIGSGGAILYGTTTFEGGTVVKYTNDPDNNPNLNINGGVNCLTSPYRPAIFTSQNDNTVGETIPGSTGTPGLLMGSYMYLVEGTTVSNMIFSYGYNGFSSCATDVEVWDCKFIDCSHPITGNYVTTTIGLHNVLIEMNTNINQGQWWGPDYALTLYNNDMTIYGEHVTADLQSLHFTYYYDGQISNFSFTNSIFQCSDLLYCWTCDNPTNPGDVTVSTNSVYFTTTPSGTVFQTMGAGNYYLATNSPCRGAGTTNLSPGILADIRSKTTWPPLLLSNTFTTPTVLSPEVQRDTSSTPDLGYHYPPIDFLNAYCLVDNTSVLLTNGVIIGYYDNLTFWLSNSATLISQGTPVQQNYIVFYRMVQEQATNLNTGYTGSTAIINSVPFLPWANNASNAASIFMRFTSVIMPIGGRPLNSEDNYYIVKTIDLRDCEFYFSGSYWEYDYFSVSNSIILTNNLFHRPYYIYIDTISSIATDNNLFVDAAGAYFAYNGDGASPNVHLNNAFDNCDVQLDGAYSNNAYLNGTTLEMTAESTAVMTNINWVTGPLGYFYQATNSPLINKGNTTANYLGLYHYTTQTTEVPEGDSIVDIGYHYVALGTNGLPISTSGDGIGDYLKDSNGNGVYDPLTDLGNWQTNSTCGDGISDYIKYLQGRNLNTCTTINDPTGVLALQVYTPLK